MKSKYGARYSDEVRQESIMRILNGARSSEVAKETGITVQTLNNWIKEHESKQASSANGSESLAIIKRLKRENKRLKDERDILKKAVTFFTKEEE